MRHRLRKAAALVERRSAYRFVVKDWREIADLDLAMSVVSSDWYTTSMRPALITPDEIESALVLAPHPDDEAIGPGGTLVRLAQQGADLRIVQVSGFEGRSEAAQLRGEAEACAARLGAGLVWIGVPNETWAVSEQHIVALRAELARQVDVVFIPWLLDSPPAHRLVNHLVALCATPGSCPREVMAYSVHNEGIPNALVDITSVAEEKRALIQLYRTQMDGQSRYDHVALGHAAWTSRHLPDVKGSGSEHFAEGFFTVPFEDYCELVLARYRRDLEATYRGQQRFVDAARRLESRFA